MTSASIPPSKSLISVSHWQNITWNLTVRRRKELWFPGYLGRVDKKGGILRLSGSRN